MGKQLGFSDMVANFTWQEDLRRTDYEAVSDGDLISIIMGLAGARVDASRVIEAFPSVWALVSAPERCLKAVGIPPKGRHLLRLMREVAIRHQCQQLKVSPILNTWQKVLDHLGQRFAGLEHEEFWVLYLDSANRLILEERAGIGTVNHVPVYPRNVIARALECQAVHILLAHNHPSGLEKPSAADIQMTQQIVAACAAVDIAVLDHMIIGAKHFSMKSAGLI